MSTAPQTTPIAIDEIPDGMILAQRGTENPLDAVESELRASVFGQNRAVESIVRAMNRARFRRKVIGEDLGWVRAVQGDVEVRRL